MFLIYSCLNDIKEMIESFLTDNDYLFDVVLDTVDEILSPTIIVHFENISFEKVTTQQVISSFELKFTIADKVNSYTEFLQKHEEFISNFLRFLFENFLSSKIEMTDFAFDTINGVASVTYSLRTGFGR